MVILSRFSSLHVVFVFVYFAQQHIRRSCTQTSRWRGRARPRTILLPGNSGPVVATNGGSPEEDHNYPSTKWSKQGSSSTQHSTEVQRTQDSSKKIYTGPPASEDTGSTGGDNARTSRASSSSITEEPPIPHHTGGLPPQDDLDELRPHHPQLHFNDARSALMRTAVEDPAHPEQVGYNQAGLAQRHPDFPAVNVTFEHLFLHQYIPVHLLREPGTSSLEEKLGGEEELRRVEHEDTTALVSRVEVRTRRARTQTYYQVSNVCIRREWSSPRASDMEAGVIPNSPHAVWAPENLKKAGLAPDHYQKGGLDWSRERFLVAPFHLRREVIEGAALDEGRRVPPGGREVEFRDRNPQEGRLLNGTGVRGFRVDDLPFDLFFYNTILSTPGKNVNIPSSVPIVLGKIAATTSTGVGAGVVSPLVPRPSVVSELFRAFSKKKGSSSDADNNSENKPTTSTPLSPLQQIMLRYGKSTPKTLADPASLATAYEIVDEEQAEPGFTRRLAGRFDVGDGDDDGKDDDPEDLVVPPPDEPIAFFQSNHFGHWYHSLSDTIFPAFVTKRNLGFERIRAVLIEQVSTKCEPPAPDKIGDCRKNPSVLNSRLFEIADSLNVTVEIINGTGHSDLHGTRWWDGKICVGDLSAVLGHWKPTCFLDRTTFCSEWFEKKLDPTLFPAMRDIQRLFWRRTLLSQLRPSELVQRAAELARTFSDDDSQRAGVGIVARRCFDKTQKDFGKDCLLLERAIFIDRPDNRFLNKSQEFFSWLEPAKQKDLFATTAPLPNNDGSAEKTRSLFQQTRISLQKVRFEDHGWPETQLILANATMLFGVTGAGFINQLWMPRGSVLVILDCTECPPCLWAPCDLETPHRPHDQIAQYLGHHVFHYQTLGFSKVWGYPMVSPPHFWHALAEFLWEVNWNMGWYLSPAAGGVSELTQGEREEDRGDSLLCDANEQSRKMRCRIFGGRAKWRGPERYLPLEDYLVEDEKSWKPPAP